MTRSTGIYNALAVSTVVWIVTAALGTSVTVPSGDFIQTLVRLWYTLGFGFSIERSIREG